MSLIDEMVQFEQPNLITPARGIPGNASQGHGYEELAHGHERIAESETVVTNLLLERQRDRRQGGIGSAQEADGTLHGRRGDLRALLRIENEFDEAPVIDGVFDGIHG